MVKNYTNIGTLYIVATPIGNMQDMTLRALETLKSVDMIACEDTRHTGMLLKHFEIKKPMVSYFQHSKLSKIEYIIEQLVLGNDIALVTDAGTPGISDPGQELIARVREIANYQSMILNESSDEQIKDYLSKLDPSMSGLIAYFKSKIENSALIRVLPMPGVSALTAAASVSGMIEKEFYFAGFLPKKKGRQTQFKAFQTLDCPIIIYESAMRLAKTLEDIRTYLGATAEVFIAREITKMFEEYWSGSVEELLNTLNEHQLKGEIVLIVRQSK